MNESSRAVLDTETPVNPYSLLEAVNRSSGTVHSAWLIFIALMSYLLITVGGVTHKDLLLNSDVALPLLQVKIDLTRFFVCAPIALVLFHAGVIGQLVLLAGKTTEFVSAIRMLEISDARTHPLRLELDNFFFVQALAGPERSRIVGALLHGMSWLTLVLAPLALLLYIQAAFLPYNDVAITQLHRYAVLADVTLLVFVGIFLLRSETSLFGAVWGGGRYHAVSLIGTAALLIGATMACFDIAALPAPPVSVPTTGLVGAHNGHSGVATVPTRGSDRALFGLLPRNLMVSDLQGQAGNAVPSDKPTLNLRGRDLRFAMLDRSDLRQADMTGAQLEGASFVEADLRGVWMQCASIEGLASAADRRAAQCVDARRTNFSKARLSDGRLAGVDLRGARLEGARLQGADLAHALMSGAAVAGAHLERADLTGGAWLQGVDFRQAHLEGADLAGARLQTANLSDASLQGANLAHANLAGAVLHEAALEGANLQFATLFGADLAGARLQGSDMTGAVVWRSLAPAVESAALADLAQVMVRPPDEGELSELRAAVDGENAVLLAPVLDASQNAGWATSPQQQAWQSLAKASETAQAEGYRSRLTEFLAKLMCRARYVDGAVATGVARRALAPGFKGDLSALLDKLKGADCPASGGVAPRVLAELAVASDAAKDP
jgi:uncharacterized protein YjbI with pentapeptide repeats